MTMLIRLLYQDAVEKFMYKKSQDAGQDIGNVIKKFHVHDHGFISSDECPTIANKAYYKYNLICQL